jgi:hypothetical protein
MELYEPGGIGIGLFGSPPEQVYPWTGAAALAAAGMSVMATPIPDNVSVRVATVVPTRLRNDI